MRTLTRVGRKLPVTERERLVADNKNLNAELTYALKDANIAKVANSKII